MSEVLELDPSRGFVALPAQLLDLEISPGAFRVLVYLCNLANEEGWSWPSLEQIGETVGRSKASISGYLDELRLAKVIKTVEQKMASGYNYRLRILVTFWSDWVEIRQRKRNSPVPKTERRVQPDERPVKHKNNIQKTHSALPSSAEVSKVKKIYDGWKILTKGLPYGQYRGQPSAELLRATKHILSQPSYAPCPAVTAVTQETLESLWGMLGVEVPSEVLTEQVHLCKDMSLSMPALHSLCEDTQSVWKKHWKKPPSAKQFEEMVRRAQRKHPLQSMLRIIGFDYRIWKDSMGNLEKPLPNAA